MDDVLRDVASSVCELIRMVRLVTGPERVLVSGEGVSLMLRHRNVLEQELLNETDAPDRLREVRLEELGFLGGSAAPPPSRSGRP